MVKEIYLYDREAEENEWRLNKNLKENIVALFCCCAPKSKPCIN